MAWLDGRFGAGEAKAVQKPHRGGVLFGCLATIRNTHGLANAQSINTRTISVALQYLLAELHPIVERAGCGKIAATI
ncbi:MAG: hypothetical protein JW818_11400 [Pirellulales bacterium]|nr:hypothetical protein [Pirellulales bacterium]